MDFIRAKIAGINVVNIAIAFDVQVAIAIILIAFLSRNMFAKMIVKLFNKIIKSNNDDVTQSSLYNPLRVFFVLTGFYLAIKKLPFNSRVQVVSEGLFEIVLMLFITKVITAFITPETIFYKTLFTPSKNKMVNILICKIIRFIIWIVSIFIIIYQQGINLNGLAAGLGIGSAVIALAAQDVVKNLLAGMAIFIDHPFNIGDFIVVGDYSGTVTDITYRSTRIKSVDNSIITVPNEKITSECLINWSRLSTRRFDQILNIPLDTPLETINKLVKQLKFMFDNHPEVVPNSAQVHFNDIGGSGNNIKIYCYLKQKDYVGFLKARQDLLCEILKIIEKENVDLAYPTQTILVKNPEEAEGILASTKE